VEYRVDQSIGRQMSEFILVSWSHRCCADTAGKPCGYNAHTTSGKSKILSFPGMGMYKAANDLAGQFEPGRFHSPTSWRLERKHSGARPVYGWVH
jgi:hypothetical protein